MTILTKQDILAANDQDLRKVEVKEWGGVIHLRVMSGAERDAYDQAVTKAGGAGAIKNFRAMTVAACACDEAGNLLFTADDVAALGQKSAMALDKLFWIAHDLNALGGDQVGN